MRKRARPVQTEPVDPPPEIPIVVAAPDPVVRAILVGPSSAAQARLSDLISAQAGIEVFARLDRADQVLSSVHDLPARRRVAVLIDTRLPGLHDAGWLIRMLRERVPVLRLFAYTEQPDDPLMEHVALAGVDEVLVVAGAESDDEVIEAFVRQFRLGSGEPAASEDLSPTEDAPVIEAVPEPPEAAVLTTPPEPAVAVLTTAPEPPRVAVPVVANPAPTPVDEAPAPEKRSRFHRRSGKPREAARAPAPDGAESAAVRNLERELAAAQRPAPEILRQVAADRAASESEPQRDRSGDPAE